MSHQTFQRTADLMHELLQLTKQLRGDRFPSPHQFLVIEGELQNCYFQLAKEASIRFSEKEQATIKRRINHAEEYKRLRGLGIKKAAQDANIEATALVSEEYDKEIQSEALYLDYQNFKAAIDRALDYCRTAISLLKTSESSPHTP